jgi:hypothetical protein
LEYRPFPGGLPPIAVDTTARTVYTYKWCARSAAAESAQNCYFDTLEDCKTEMTGIIGNCYPNPFYRAPPPAVVPFVAGASRAQVVAKKPPVAAAPRGQVAAKKLPEAAAPRAQVAAKKPPTDPNDR